MKKIFLSMLLIASLVNCQTFTVNGNILTLSSVPVKNASIIFTSKSDTSKKYFATTDSLGYYKLELITSIGNFELLPTTIELEQNYPNPFSEQTTISYKLNKQEAVTVKIYDLLGQVIKSFEVGSQSTGKYNLRWDGRNEFGQLVSNGIYFYQLQTGKESIIKKMILNNTNRSIANPKFVSKHNYENRISKNKNILDDIYNITVKSTDSTMPLIVQQEFTELSVAENSTFNFDVEKARIILFKSIDEVKIGDDSLTVVEKLGEPDEIQPGGDCDCYVFYYFYGINSTTRVDFLNNVPRDSTYSVMQVLVEVNYVGKTKEGIGLGASRNLVISALGEPTYTNMYTEQTSDSYIKEVPFNGYLQTRFTFRYDKDLKLIGIVMWY